MSHASALSFALILLLSPILPGVINRTKAFFAGRQGQPILQLYFDLAKLLRKGAVYSKTTSAVFKLGPIITLASCIAALFFVPSMGIAPLASFPGDVLLVFYLLALARFFTISAALDTGSAFEGMGASREAFFGALTEISVFLTFFFLAVSTGAFSLHPLLTQLTTIKQLGALELLLVAAGWFCVLLAENCRIPVDDPNTHLELTMIHEVMVLDHGGVDFAFVQYAASLKLALFSSIFFQLLVPLAPPHPADALMLFWLGLVGTAVLVGIVESIMARFKMVSVPQFIAASWISAGLGLIILLTRIS